MKTKPKKFAILPLIVVTLGTGLIGLWTLKPSLADNYTSNAECSGNDISVTASAPASVTQGSTFTVTNINSTSTAPNGITVNKAVSTSTISNATPSSTTGTWTGAGTGTFTTNFPDLTLTASGPVGSQIKLSLTSIDLYVNGLTTAITCSVANGNLVGSTPGQPITLMTTTIKAAPATSTPSATTKKTTTTEPTPATDTTSINSTSNTTSDSSKDSSTTSSKTVTVTVTNKSSKTLANIKVTLDNLPPAYTNDQGVATFENVSAGEHKAYVWTAKKPIEHGFTLGASTEKTFAVAIQVPSQNNTKQLLIGVMSGLVLLAGVGAIILWRLRKKQQALALPVPAVTQTAPLPSPTATSTPSPTIQTPTPPDDITNPQPPVGV